MKKPTINRILLGLIQNGLAAVIFMVVAYIMYFSAVSVDSMNGTTTYKVNPLNEEGYFEDSVLFQEIFETAVSDITKLVVIKDLLENDGKFSANKLIDVNDYVTAKNIDNNANVTAVYELDNLIKWGKYGVEMSSQMKGVSDFVQYFGNVLYVDNFMVDESGELMFCGFNRVGDSITELDEQLEISNVDAPDGIIFRYSAADSGVSYGVDLNNDEQLAVYKEMLSLSDAELEILALNYIIENCPSDFTVSTDDDGFITVSYGTLICRYLPIDGIRQLEDHVDNWIDYFALKNNTVDTIKSITAAYDQYVNCVDLYNEGKTNLYYVVRINTNEGTKNFSNSDAFKSFTEDELTEYFAEYTRYLIYYPENLEFMGNSSITQDDIYSFMSEYEYAYTDSSYIWIGVDTTYAEEDAFHNAYEVYNNIVPKINKLVIAVIVLTVIWVLFLVFLSITSGLAKKDTGELIPYTTVIDRIWIELLALSVYGVYAFGRYIWERLNDVVTLEIVQRLVLKPTGTVGMYQYGIFAVFGFLLSALICSIWYSLIRRLRANKLFEYSFCNWALEMLRKGTDFVFTHRNMAFSTLLPYNLFLLTNFVGVIWAYNKRESRLTFILLIVGLIVFDTLVGVLMFKNSAEWVDIFEGIRRIRDGEVDFKIDTTNLHGSNREMADSVNNIGEGIRKAVSTSMKDEQMKTDLITNVSHDIKTPLTSIINYVDLLKRIDIKDDQAVMYINILDNKAQRLKQLTDDLVEVSKISSGNIILDFAKLDLAELLEQTVGEFSEKMESRSLAVVFERGGGMTYIKADSRRMWRVVENLFNNICKYAMENTRVYVDVRNEDGMVIASIKNISAQQMNITPDELTERFIRGDQSRTTEGSGLGLSIAKSLTNVQGGEFAIDVDGDLFKVTIKFPEYIEEPVVSEIEEKTSDEE